MSRTDKDAPYWVRAECYVPVHNHCQFDHTWWGWTFFPDGPRECDLPEDPIIRHPRQRRRAYGVEKRSCRWEAEWSFRSRYNFTWGPRPIDRRLYYWKPERAQKRTACDRARKEYNSFGQTEVEVPMFQHRHAETTGGGYWD
jgi:hypothetical protein